MPAIAPVLLLAASLAPAAPPDATAAPHAVPSVLEEALASTDVPARFRLQPPPGALVGIGDANGDGLADVVVATSRARHAWILPGDGKGSLGEFQRLDAPMGPQGIGDLDGDGVVEQISGGAFGTEAVLVQGKAGTPLPALTADLDGDGAADLARLDGDALRITFAEAGREALLRVGADAVSLAAADIDGDGALDLLVADAHADQVSLFLSDGQGRFRGIGGLSVWLRPYSLGTGDLDGDGVTDLVVSDQCGSTLAVLRGTGSGGFGEPRLIEQSSGPRATATDAPRLVNLIRGLTLSPATLSRQGERVAHGTVRLEAPAPAQGLTLRLKTSDPSLVAPDAEVMVPPGETSVTFPVAVRADTRRGRLSYVATLTATAEGSAASATLTVSP